MTEWWVILAIGLVVAFGVILFWAGMLLIINALFMWFAGDMLQDELNSLKEVIDENRNN